MSTKQRIIDAANDPSQELLCSIDGEVLAILKNNATWSSVELLSDRVRLVDSRPWKPEEHRLSNEARRYAALRQALVEGDKDFIQSVLDALPPEPDGKVTGRMVDAAFDYAIFS